MTLLHNRRIANNIIIELVRNIDAKTVEYNYAKSQLRSNVDYIDMEAQNTFSERVSISKLKCIAGYNHHR